MRNNNENNQFCIPNIALSLKFINKNENAYNDISKVKKIFSKIIFIIFCDF